MRRRGLAALHVLTLLLKRLRTTLLLTLILCVFSLTAGNRPYSLLYKYLHCQSCPRHAADDLNRHRVEVAKDYFIRVSHLDGFEKARGLPTKHETGVKVAIALITVRRRSPHPLGYVIQSAATLHSLLSHQQAGALFADSVLFLCNVDVRPELHRDAIFLQTYLPVVQRYGASSPSTTVNSSSMRVPGLKNRSYMELVHNDTYDKERVDYMFCLHSALYFHPDYVLLVEDDAVALPDMPSVVQHALDTLAHKEDHTLRHDLSSADLRSSRPGPDCQHINSSDHVLDGTNGLSQVDFSSFVYLKLFFPVYWQGFAFELLRLLDLLCMTIVLATGIVCCLQVGSLVIKLKLSSKLRSRQVAYFTLAFSLLVCLLYGRQNMNELRRVSKYFYRLQTSPDCCTPAILFPCAVIPALMTSLSKCQSAQHVDLCMADFVKHSGMPAYNIEPNLFSHIGTVTSLGLGDKRSEEVLFHGEPLHFEV